MKFETSDRRRIIVAEVSGRYCSSLPSELTARGQQDHEAGEEAGSDTVITIDEAGLLIPVLARTAQVGLLNHDSDVAVELCEVVAAVGLALRSSPPAVSTDLLRRGVGWAGLVTELLSAGAWTADPARLTPAEQDANLAANLRADLDVIRALLDTIESRTHAERPQA